MSEEEAQLIYRVLDTLSQKIGNVAPGRHQNFYAEYNEAWSILRREGAVSPQEPPEGQTQ